MRLAVKVQARARRAGVQGWQGEVLRIAVREPAVDGRANRAVCALLADALEVAPGGVRIVGGQHSSRKLIEIAGVDADEVRSRLGAGAGT